MVTLLAHDQATGRTATIIIPRAEFRLWLSWLRALGKTRFYDVIFALASKRLQ